MQFVKVVDHLNECKHIPIRYIAGFPSSTSSHHPKQTDYTSPSTSTFPKMFTSTSTAPHHTIQNVYTFSNSTLSTQFPNISRTTISTTTLSTSLKSTTSTLFHTFYTFTTNSPQPFNDTTSTFNDTTLPSTPKSFISTWSYIHIQSKSKNKTFYFFSVKMSLLFCTPLLEVYKH